MLISFLPLLVLHALYPHSLESTTTKMNPIRVCHLSSCLCKEVYIKMQSGLVWFAKLFQVSFNSLMRYIQLISSLVMACVFVCLYIYSFKFKSNNWKLSRILYSVWPQSNPTVIISSFIASIFFRCLIYFPVCNLKFVVVGSMLWNNFNSIRNTWCQENHLLSSSFSCGTVRKHQHKITSRMQT